MPGSDGAGSGPWLALGRLLLERAGYIAVIFALAVQGGTIRGHLKEPRQRFTRRLSVLF
jgi:hypothetical protein